MIEIITEKVFINSLLALLVISIATGVLGSFMIWQKLSYLGDSISHSSLLGIALAHLLHTNTSISITIISLIFALLLSFNLDKLYSVDTVLNIITNVTLALGLLLISVLPGSNNSIINSLFGDILMISYNDLIIISCASLLIIFFMLYRWKEWLIIAINQDLAISEGINVTIVRLEFLIILAVFIAVSSQLIGILLITAFLVIPAASARLITKTPIQMIIVATIISIISGISGLLVSIQFDTLSGPSIIMVAFVHLIITYIARKIYCTQKIS